MYDVAHTHPCSLVSWTQDFLQEETWNCTEEFNVEILHPTHGDNPVTTRLEPFYRSDVAWLDRLPGEAAVDLTPEELADRAAGRFRSGA